MNVLELVPKGYGNAVGRKELVRALGVSDRDARERLKAEADKAHIPVVNLQDGNGYFVPDREDIEILRRYIAQELSRARKILKRARHAEKYLKKLEME